MDLGLDEDQRVLAELIDKSFLDGVKLARDAEPLGFHPQAWKRACELGLAGMGLPEQCGGGDAPLDLLVVVAEGLGRHILPVPFVEHVVASRMLSRTGVPRSLLSNLAAGSDIATIALGKPIGESARLVPAGAIARFVLVTRTGQVVLIDDAPLHHSRANFADSPCADRSLLHSQEIASPPDRFPAALAEWRTLSAAQLVGIAARALEITVAYAKTREQFGRPIGGFQAVAHGLADLPGLIDGARFLVHEAAWALEGGDRSFNGVDGRSLSLMAMHFAAETAALVTARSVQYHGGYGYAREQDPQLYYRRARGISLSAGPLPHYLDDLAGELFGPVAG